MVSILKIEVEKDLVKVTFSNQQWARIHKFGGTHYSEVSDFIPKSSLISIWKLINWALPKSELEQILYPLVGATIKTVYEL